MYIKKINKFLPNYKNLEKGFYLNILNFSNKNFVLHKIEKDFLLTIILIKFWEKYPDLIFKGWTCLNKIYFPYFRLSEDLDFVINSDLWRTARQTLLKKYENEFISDLAKLWLKLKDERTKFDGHKQAMFNFEYTSILDESIQTIKIDISLKKIYIRAFVWEIKSIYKDSILEEYIFWNHHINCIDLKESVAEKLRASLTRRESAIRDLFDIWFIKNNSNFDFDNEEFLDLLDKKLKEENYKYTLDQSYEQLKKQIDTDLIPVLSKDYDFNLDAIYDFILKFRK